MRQGNLSVVLATYNEVEAIGPMVQQLLSQLDQDGGPLLDVIVVDDDSPDGTAQVVRVSAARTPEYTCCCAVIAPAWPAPSAMGCFRPAVNWQW